MFIYNQYVLFFMEDYEVIEHGKKKDSYTERYTIVAINYKIPTYAKIISKVDIKRGTIVQIDEKEHVFLNGQEIGTVIDFKTGDQIKVDTDHDIKYTGGYSIDGKTVFLDEHFPKIIEVDGKQVDTRISIDRHHEIPEKWLSDDAYEYPYAHEIATKIEREYVESLGVKWEDYCREVDKHLRDVYRRKLKDSPGSLDLAPYLYSRDKEALKEIRDSKEDK